MTYSEKLKDPRWQKKRLQILNRDNWTCQKCLDKETTLHVHHLEYNGNPWEVDNNKLITLCDDCHDIIEEFKDSDFTKIKIRKIISPNNFKTMLISNKGVIHVRFYKNNEQRFGFCGSHSLIPDFLEILNDANNYKNE